MIITELTWKNLKSYGNNPHTLRLDKDKGELILLVGPNGAGKCLDKDTKIEIEIDENLYSLLKEIQSRPMDR